MPSTQIRINADTDWYSGDVLTPNVAWNSLVSIKADLRINTHGAHPIGNTPFDLVVSPSRLQLNNPPASNGASTVVITLDYAAGVTSVTIHSEKGAIGGVRYTSQTDNVFHGANDHENLVLTLP